MPYRVRKTSEIERQLHIARRHLASLDEKRAELMEHIAFLEGEFDKILELEDAEKKVAISTKVPEIEELAEQVGQPLKAIQSVGNSISFIYDVDGREVIYAFDDADEGAKSETARLKKLLREIGVADKAVV